jgi:hypothetical protein
MTPITEGTQGTGARAEMVTLIKTFITTQRAQIDVNVIIHIILHSRVKPWHGDENNTLCLSPVCVCVMSLTYVLTECPSGGTLCFLLPIFTFSQHKMCTRPTSSSLYMFGFRYLCRRLLYSLLISPMFRVNTHRHVRTHSHTHTLPHTSCILSKLLNSLNGRTIADYYYVLSTVPYCTTIRSFDIQTCR